MWESLMVFDTSELPPLLASANIQQQRAVGSNNLNQGTSDSSTKTRVTDTVDQSMDVGFKP